jgi:hypothetical protein
LQDKFAHRRHGAQLRDPEYIRALETVQRDMEAGERYERGLRTFGTQAQSLGLGGQEREQAHNRFSAPAASPIPRGGVERLIALQDRERQQVDHRMPIMLYFGSSTQVDDLRSRANTLAAELRENVDILSHRAAMTPPEVLRLLGIREGGPQATKTCSTRSAAQLKWPTIFQLLIL